ncbi:uncharacterized protein EV154DRAFT_495960 [Mucor mucedo]|uniref:uncharacterized protein n=1 Tax=Mucor mucedo TaxID=29922 RepID=UPI002220848F|nr:uncharacterized protein EV154DRAFT_495960 [Mucor mucedo]KAI7895123.1 hypothetical protein EV154DRAFT_495960 [Mucor mucedo]
MHLFGISLCLVATSMVMASVQALTPADLSSLSNHKRLLTYSDQVLAGGNSRRSILARRRTGNVKRKRDVKNAPANTGVDQAQNTGASANPVKSSQGGEGGENEPDENEPDEDEK